MASVPPGGSTGSPTLNRRRKVGGDLSNGVGMLLLGLAVVGAGGGACAPGVDGAANPGDASASGGRTTTASGGSGSGGDVGSGASGGAFAGSGGSTGAGGSTFGSGGSGSGSGGSVGSGGSDTTSSGGTTGSGGRASGTGGGVAMGGRGGGAVTGGRGGTGGNTATGGSGSGTGGAGSGVIAQPSRVFAPNQCRFHFGTLDARARTNAPLKAQIDLFTPGWVGQSDNFNMASVCTSIKAGGTMVGVVPAVVSYIIAFAARRDQGLQDCNVSGSTNLCRYGATYIRNHLEDRIIPIYSNWAKGFAASCGTTMPIIWLMEPDYYQYSTGGDARALTPAEAGQIMGRLVATVRQSLPNAIFSLDISPWIPNNGRDWYANFNMSDFTYINTSGGGTDASSPRIRPTDGMTWAGVHQVTGKPIIADTGYGVAGAPTGHDARWDVAANLNARIADGVIGIMQYNPNTNWGSTITQIRPQLTAIPCQ